MTHRALFRSPIQRRLAPLTAAAFFGGIALWVPVEKLFLADIGFTPQTIGVMAAAYAGVVPLLEIPSGILADRWSRRGTLLIGNAAMLLSVVVGGLSTNVATYVVAALLLGVYFSMQSGTVDAVVYDAVLEETGDSDGFESVVGRLRMVESASLVLGALGGGALAALTAPRVTYFATVPFLIVSTASLLAFREPRLHQQGEIRPLRQHIAVTIGAVRHNRRLAPVAALLVLTSILTQGIFEFGPLWLVDAGAGAGAFGPAWAGLMASLGIGGAVAGRVRIERSAGLSVLVALLLVATSTLLFTSHAIAVTVAQMVVAVVSVAVGIILTRLLHDAVGSDVRSGVASVVGAATWATFIPFAVGFGAISDRWNVHVAGWLLVAVAAAVAVLLASITRHATTSSTTTSTVDLPCRDDEIAVAAA
jgi:MFS family permease